MPPPSPQWLNAAITATIGSGPFQKAIRGLQPLSTGLTAFALVASQGAGLIYASAASSFTRLTLAANKGIYATSASALATFDLSAFGRTLAGSADAAAARTTLGISTGWPKSTYGTGTTAADLDGVNTYTWATLVGSTYTMTSNAYLTDCTVRNGITLAKRYIPYINGTLTVEATGVVHDDGNAASGTTAGATIVSTTRLPESSGFAGGNGRSTTGTGNNGSAANPGVGGAGGAGGAGGGNAGGSPGAVTPPNARTGGIQNPCYSTTYLLPSVTNWIVIHGGTGGGGGGCATGTGTASSGAGGGGAPVSILCAKTIVNNGTIRFNGGAGSAATATGDGAAGGGGGGGGGYGIIVTDAAPTGSGTITASGGAAGAGAGGGAAGTAGSAGTVEYRVAS